MAGFSFASNTRCFWPSTVSRNWMGPLVPANDSEKNSFRSAVGFWRARLRLAIRDYLDRHEILVGGIRNSPELFLSRFHLDHRLCAADARNNLIVDRQLIRPGNPWHLKLLADDKNALGESRHFGMNF